MKRSILAKVKLITIIGSIWLLPIFCVAAQSSEQALSIGTHPVGTRFNVIGTAVAKVIGEKTPYRITVKAMAGPVAWLPYMERAEVDFGVLNVWDAEKAYKGEYEYKDLSKGKGFDVRLVALSVPNKISILAAKDSGITRISEMKGKRLACNYPTPSLQLQALAVLANAGLTLDDVRVVPVTSIDAGVQAVIQGRADAAGSCAIGTPVVEELEAKRGALFLPLDPSPDAVARVRNIFPGYPILVKAGPTGVPTDRYLWAYDVYIICRKDLPDSLVYEVTKALYENVRELQSFHKALSEWTEKSLVSSEFSVPFHPGAVRLYKEVGLWTPAMEDLNKKLLKE